MHFIVRDPPLAAAKMQQIQRKSIGAMRESVRCLNDKQRPQQHVSRFQLSERMMIVQSQSARHNGGCPPLMSV